jgi:hypothetical protein
MISVEPSGDQGPQYVSPAFGQPPATPSCFATFNKELGIANPGRPAASS